MLGCADVAKSGFSDKIALIEMSGTIQYDGSTCSPAGLKDALTAAEEDATIKAVVLRVDSGGGVAAAGEEMAETVKGFTKPIVISTASLNASAAYEISSQADYIFALNSSSVGSIGTALEITNLAKLYEMLGIQKEVIVSAESKDSSYGLRELTDDEKAQYQEMVNTINDQFITTVAEGRSMSEAEVRELATGMTFSGMQGVENGLIDEIGGIDDALNKAAELSGVSDYEKVVIKKDMLDFDIMDMLASQKIFGNDVSNYIAERYSDNVIVQ